MPDAIDYRPGQVVWLVPRTLAPAREAWDMPRVTVTEVVPPMVRVRLDDGRELTVHARDLSRSDPTRPRIPHPRPAPAGRDDSEQLTLWP